MNTLRLALSFVLATILLTTAPLSAQQSSLPDARPNLVDNTEAARQALEEARGAARSAPIFSPAERASRMVELGMWGAVDTLLASVADPGVDLQVAAAELHFQRHEFAEAERLVDEALSENPDHRGARLLNARLEVQAWRLDAAEAIARDLLADEPRNEAAALLLGRLALLRKDYAGALEWAKAVESWNPVNADAYLLEADTRFWAQDPAGAEAPLTRALALDPFDADARFNYGYAIWRRVDATQLDDMAAQWDLALEVDPLHYITHWHWGNGHTNLTYADYVHPTDSIVRARLAPADSLISAGEINSAIEIARQVQREFPESVLPAMLRGSAFYMAYDMDPEARLDSAQAIFEGVLEKKSHYGPAHNGLAAVIKQRQFGALAVIDSLEAVIAATPLPADSDFMAVFPDVEYYPGERVQKMVRAQLGPSIAYIPLLHRLDREFVLPPLHKTLAVAMDRPSLHTSTTFDNRQWMDIRGVGSGATAIEYIERGSHLERNVVAHEYTHLFHGRVLSDREVRRIRELYYNAMEEGRTLDYYASNNESEFFAQAYEAYLSAAKVHPLTHKAINTREDLRLKDPATYAFVDSLIQKQQAYLEGDSSVFRSNWAQVYLNLSEDARRSSDGADRDERFLNAQALLDTALVWDAEYLPALLSYAALMREQSRFADADAWLDRAEALNPGYAPIYSARAEVVAARSEGSEDSLQRQVELYQRALSLEEDLAIRADLSGELRQLYFRHARIPEAIEVAEQYVATAPTTSTYLRDRREDAAAFANSLRASAGYASETLDFFRNLVGQNPQQFGLRAQFAEALVLAGNLAEARRTLEEAQRIVSSAGQPDPGFMTRLAEIHILEGDTAAARQTIEPILAGRVEADDGNLRLVRVLASLSLQAEANQGLPEYDPEEDDAIAMADLDFTRGWMSEAAGETSAAIEAYRNALAGNPYHVAARVRLIELLRRSGQSEDAAALIANANALPLPLGPVFERAVAGG